MALLPINQQVYILIIVKIHSNNNDNNNDDTKCTISTHVAFRTTVANPGSGSGLPRNHQTAIRCLLSFSSSIFLIEDIALYYYCMIIIILLRNIFNRMAVVAGRECGLCMSCKVSFYNLILNLSNLVSLCQKTALQGSCPYLSTL